MEKIQKSIEVDRPIRSVYNLATQSFEEFPPLYRSGVKQVQTARRLSLAWFHDELRESGILDQIVKDFIEKIARSGDFESTWTRYHSGIIACQRLV